MRPPFADRRHAGQLLGARLAAAPVGGAVVLGLPRGGVPVAAEVAAALSAPLDVLLVRKIGVPGQAELAMGAVGEGGVVVTNPAVIDQVAVTGQQFDAAAARERVVLDDRACQYRQVRAAVPLDGCVAVLVDDGVATGASARAACRVARARGAARVLLATPVIARSAAVEFTRAGSGVAEKVIALLTPESFGGVGQFYADFAPTRDAQVREILRTAAGR